MSYLVLARKYRPQTLDEVVGQDHITRTLKNAIRQNRVAHAYIFVGPRGTGKTSTARIMAKCLNCEGGPKTEFDPGDTICQEIADGRCLDVIEIDAASNRGIDQIRQLREDVAYSPTRGKFKIYIIDEVHMLTKEAFNALLKTLEEPPPHVKFFFATTEADKVLPTIMGRCQRFDLKPIPDSLIVNHLQMICDKEGVTIETQALEAIARGAEGGMRDAEGALDQLISFCDKQIVEDDVLRVFGLASQAQVSGLSEAILQGQTEQALSQLSKISESGKDLTRVLADLLTHFRNLLILKVTREIPPEVPAHTGKILQEQIGLAEADNLLRIVDHLVAAEGKIKFSLSKKTFFEIAVIKAIRARDQVSIDAVIKYLNSLKGGASTTQTPAPSIPPAPLSTAPTATPAEVSPRTAAPKQIAPAPAPVPAPSSGDTNPVDIHAVWSAVIASAAVERPLIQTYVSAGKPLSMDGDTLVVGFNKANEFFAHQLNTPKQKDFITDKIREAAGRHLAVGFRITDSVEAASAPAPAQSAQPVTSRPKPAPSPESVITAPEEPPAKPDIAITAPPREPQKKSLDDLKSDPFIKEAMEVFRARIIDYKPAKN